METQSKVFVSRKFNCTKTELFDWLTQPDLIVKWFGPQKMSAGKVVTDFRIGGNYSIELQKEDNNNFFVEGEYIEINEPDNLAFTLQYVGLPTSPPESIVKINLEETAVNEVLLTLTQSFTIIPLDMEKRTVAWEFMLQNLATNFK